MNIQINNYMNIYMNIYININMKMYMRRFPEPQHFFAAGWQNWDFRPSRKGPRWILLIINLVYIKYLALVAPGFEGSKSQKIILKGLRTLRTWGLAKNTFTLGGSRTLQEGPLRNLSKYSEAMVHLLLLLPKQLWTDPQRKGARRVQNPLIL